ncbi:MAG TPA: aldo/keto reductase [Anaerolineaceae bacterium]
MEMRFLGGSGLQVSAFAFGTATFGVRGDYFTRLGETTDAGEARRLVEICLEAGVNLFDTADGYSGGGSEELLGKALQGYRDQVLISTKVFSRMGDGPNDMGLSRAHIIRACEDSLRRLGTDYIDLYQAHEFDAFTPLEETLAAFDQLVQSGKVRYTGSSNFTGWQMMKALSISDRHGCARFVSQQVYYSLVARDLENELVPLALDQKLGILVWSPLAGGYLTGKFRRGQPKPAGTRRANVEDLAFNLPDEQIDAIVDVLCAVAGERGVPPAQVGLNWLLRKPGVTAVIVGARNAEQLRANLQAASWQLSDEEMRRLNEVSAVPAGYPYWHQQMYGVARNPLLPQVRPE